MCRLSCEDAPMRASVSAVFTFTRNFMKDALVDVVGDDGSHGGLSSGGGGGSLHRSGELLFISGRS